MAVFFDFEKFVSQQTNINVFFYTYQHSCSILFYVMQDRFIVLKNEKYSRAEAILGGWRGPSRATPRGFQGVATPPPDHLNGFQSLLNLGRCGESNLRIKDKRRTRKSKTSIFYVFLYNMCLKCQKDFRHPLNIFLPPPVRNPETAPVPGPIETRSMKRTIFENIFLNLIK